MTHPCSCKRLRDRELGDLSGMPAWPGDLIYWFLLNPELQILLGFHSLKEIYLSNRLQIQNKCVYLQSQYENGALAERLGTGLQNLLERFDSARHL